MSFSLSLSRFIVAINSLVHTRDATMYHVSYRFKAYIDVSIQSPTVSIYCILWCIVILWLVLMIYCTLWSIHMLLKEKNYFLCLLQATQSNVLTPLCIEQHIAVLWCIRGNKSYRYVHTLYCCNSSSYSATNNALKVKASHYPLTYFCEL